MYLQDSNACASLPLTGSNDRFLAPQRIVITRNAEKSVITYQILELSYNIRGL